MYSSEEILKFLRELGLTKQEAKVYLTLLIHGEMSATELAKAMNLHFPQLYNIMSSLEVKGFIEVQEGRPKRYKAVDINYVSSRRIAEIKSRAKKVIKLMKI
ncbi:MAG: TrmB family transcriptional regulator [Staphylothermus sp.]|nr:TrmB family transcriptional regulator [Staphylothermus sp.]